MSDHEALVFNTKQSVRDAVVSARKQGRTIGVVPTMGALHQGHLSLVEAARNQTDYVVVTIFVNPTQFGPGEDFEKYPRTLDSDLRLLAPLGVDAVFSPADGEMYAPDHSTIVSPPRVAKSFEGEHRTEHFQGVTTVVLKLFNVTAPDYAFFGQKDFQQSLVIRHMVADLDVPVSIVVCPTVRDPDGLAMSSRNAYLSDSQREIALSLSRGLRSACERVVAGDRDAKRIESAMHEQLVAAGVDRVDYARVVDGGTLQSVDTADDDSVALIAAYVGHTRLIDNVRLNETGLSQL